MCLNLPEIEKKKNPNGTQINVAAELLGLAYSTHFVPIVTVRPYCKPVAAIKLRDFKCDRLKIIVFRIKL